MSGHTLGPWRVVNDGLLSVSASANGHGVASIGSPTAERDANARLIASAPELLESLIDVLGWIPNGGPWHTDAPMKAVERARAVIAKARGESP